MTQHNKLTAHRLWISADMRAVWLCNSGQAAQQPG